MATPANFDSNAADAVRWTDNHLRRECSASAYGVLFTMQSNLLYAASLNGGQLGSWNPSSLNAIDRTSGDGWNRATLDGLRAFLTRYRAPASFVTAVTRDLTLAPNSRLSQATVQAALWTETSKATANGQDTYGAGSPAEIVLAGGSTTPRFGSRPSVPANGVVDLLGFECRPIPSAPQSGRSPFSSVGAFLTSPLGVLTIVGAAAVAISLSTDKARKSIRGK